MLCIPVAHFDGHAAWLYEDVKLYRRQLATPKRAEDEYQRLFVGLSELANRLEKNVKSVCRAAGRKRWANIPQPEGELGVGIYYWRREKAEAWFEQRNLARTKQEAKQP